MTVVPEQLTQAAPLDQTATTVAHVKWRQPPLQAHYHVWIGAHRLPMTSLRTVLAMMEALVQASALVISVKTALIVVSAHCHIHASAQQMG